MSDLPGKPTVIVLLISAAVWAVGVGMVAWIVFCEMWR